jgi:hypothetical protein
MRSFRHLLILLSLAVGLDACARAARVPATIHRSWIEAKSAILPSSRHKSKPRVAPQLRYAAYTATLGVTYGLKVGGVVPLPGDFEPDMSRAPLWLGGGREVAVVGTRAGKGVILGFSGGGLSQQRVVIEDGGPGALAGRLLDVATSADGRMLATAVGSDSRDRLDVNLAETSNPGGVQPIASLEGEFDSAQLNWLSSGNIALLAQAVTPANDESTARTAAVPVSGLYLITIGPDTSMRRLDDIKCPLSPLAFSPNDAFAVAQGRVSTPPALVNVHEESCKGFASGDPLQVIGWAPNSQAFLYRIADQVGVLRFDLLSGHSSTITISSGAAAFASDGTIIAYGSQQLSWRRVISEPTASVKAQIALFDPHQDLITINSLGFATQAALMAQSRMVFSKVSNDTIIDTATPGGTELVRELIEYSYPARAAFILAHGAVRGPITISWSPDGKQIAIVDGDATRRTLAVIVPPK